MRCVFISILLFLTDLGTMQAGITEKADSLRRLLQGAPDTMQMRLYWRIGVLLRSNYPDSTMHYGRILGRLAKNSGSDLYMERSYDLIGDAHNAKGIYDSSIYYYLQSLKLVDKSSDKQRKSHSLNSLGNAYLGLHNYEMAMEYYEKCYASASSEPQDPHMMGIASFGIANCSQQGGRLDKALEYFDKAIIQFRAEGNTYAEAFTMLAVASIYEEKKDLAAALKLHFEALKLLEKIDDKYGIGNALRYIGNNLVAQGRPVDAISYLLRALDVHSSRKSWFDVSGTSHDLSKAYELAGDFRNAHKYYVDYKTYSDSSLNEKSQQQLLDVEAKYKNELQEEELKRKSLEIEEANAETERKEKLILVFIALSFIFFAMAFFSFRQYRLKNKVNALLEEKSAAIQEQHTIIELKNKDITDSIRYARHIQEAVLPPQDLMYELLKECFVVYIPKDIVSGDFYWVKKLDEDRVLFAAIDCTGHGVPGAFMSVLAHSAITRVAEQYDLAKPSLILNYLSDAIKETFRHHHYEGNISDGMDLSLCMLDRKRMKLHFAGARNPVVLISNADMKEIKGDKQFISGTRDHLCEAFTQHELDLKKGDMIYIFTDGYSDQFGGPQGKKFKQSRLRDLLTRVSTENIHNQKRILEKTILDWKGNLEQIDDILVMGVRV